MGKIFENLLKKPKSQKVQLFFQGDLMAIKKNSSACVYIRNINMTQVSDLAPGPVVD
jgi:hypothetical protein